MTKDWTIFRTNDFIQNAGIIGLIRLLEHQGASRGQDYCIDGTDLSVSTDYLLRGDLPKAYVDLSKAYMDAFIDKYYQETHHAIALQKIAQLRNLLAEADGSDGKEKQKDLITYLHDKLSSASYQSGYAILEEKNIQTDIVAILKKLKKEKDKAEILRLLSELEEELNKPLVKETLAFKSIIYSRINMFWENKAFLLPKNSKRTLEEVFSNDFTEPLVNYIQKSKKSKDTCIACGNPISGKEKTSIAFMKDMADDLSRKTSAFWNCKVDAFICPNCAFLYALVPLGFVPIGNDMVFVNTNTNIEFLEQSNRAETLNIEKDDNLKLSILYNTIIANLIKTSKLKASNIQVITRRKFEERYDLNIIGKDVIEILENARKPLENLMKWHVKDGEQYINVYERTIVNVINGQNQYGNINRLFRLNLDQSRIVFAIYNVLMVQFHQCNNKKRKGGNAMNKARLSFACKGGNDLRRTILDYSSTGGDNQDESDNKLRGTVYQFLNALQVGDQFAFMNMLLRLSTSYNMKVPSVFMDAFQSEEDFLNIAYAFLVGLKGGYFEKEKKGNEAMDEQIQEMKGQSL
jgi:CRISPR-associated protein Cst1